MNDIKTAWINGWRHALNEIQKAVIEGKGNDQLLEMISEMNSNAESIYREKSDLRQRK